MPGRRALVAVAVVALTAAASCSGDDAASDASPTTRRPPASTTTTTAAAATTSSSTSAPARADRFISGVEEVTATDLHASWREGCPLPVEQLRAVDVSHWGFDDQVHTGRIIVAADQADTVLAVFHELYDAHYPIERIEPVDAYGGSDEASMDANNTSAFNCRPATGSTSWSNHAYGRAIDLNPLQNPYVKGGLVLPPQSAHLVDRTRTDQGVIHDGDAAVSAFASHGWSWGGHWTTLKDYQHFDVE